MAALMSQAESVRCCLEKLIMFWQRNGRREHLVRDNGSGGFLLPIIKISIREVFDVLSRFFRMITSLFAPLLTCSPAFSDNYEAYLNNLSGPNTAVIVVDMFESNNKQLSGFPSTASSISAITEQVSSRGGLVICVIERISRRDGRYCPESVIPASARKTEEGRRYTTITKDQPSAFYQTGLMATLNRNNITQILVVGAYSALCVRDTTEDALTNGLNVTLLFSAITATPGYEAAKIFQYGEEGIVAAEAEDFFSLVDSLETSWNRDKLSVICAPSRKSNRKDRFDPDNGFGFTGGKSGNDRFNQINHISY